MNRFMKMYMEAQNPEGGDNPAAPAAETKTYTQAELDAAIAGLKTKNDELLGEKKSAAQRAKDEEAQRILAQQEAAKSSGKLEEFEKTIRGQYEPQLAERDKRLSAMQERILGSERKSVINSFLGDFVDPSAADVLSLLVKTEFDGDEVVTKFVGADGKVITTEPEQFRKYLREHKAFSHLMKADAATGGGAGGNKNANGGATSNSQLTGIDKTRADINKRLNEKFK
jgi:hypothetical protein